MFRSFLVTAALAAFLACAAPASAAIFVFKAPMSGLNEVPPNASTATGFTTISLNDESDTMSVDVAWDGLIGGPPAAAHIHCCTAPGSNVTVAVGFPSFPNTLSGAYSHIFNLLDPSIYTTTFLNTFGGGTAAGAETALINGLLAGDAYTNIHNAVFPGGEIRGLLAVVPEPGAWALMLSGFGLIGAALRRRRPAVTA